MQIYFPWVLLLMLLLWVPSGSGDDCPDYKSLSENERFDCYPQPDATQEKCKERRCCWEPTSNPYVPWCFYSKNYGGYKSINFTSDDKGQFGFYKRMFPSPYPRDIHVMKLEIEYQTDTRVRIKMSDAEKRRYETPYPKIKPSESVPKSKNYKVEVDEENFGFKVVRNDNSVLFNCQKIGGFIFSDQFLQISSPIDGIIYGLGEHRTEFWLNNNWEKYTLFTHDAPPTENFNLYGSHPFFLVMQSSGKSFGVYLHNSNAMDVILQPLPAITYRTIGGILDFFIFTGPTPADVVRQYTELIGRPFLPPYWSLGFQLCKYGYGSEKVTREIWQRNKDAGIPLDVMWNDIDYMENQNDFTVSQKNYANLPQLVQDIHSAGMHYVVILDPGVSASEPKGTYPPFEEGMEMDIFIKDHKDRVFVGKVWNPNATVFPDFTNPKTQVYWTKQIRGLRETIKFDGLWIDMNEPANFLDGSFEGCPKNELEDPPYVPNVDGGILRKKTLCMSAKQHAGIHYDVHNIFGISEHDMTYNSLKDIIKKRVFTLSRSTSPGSGTYGGHWSGDVFSTWHDLTKSVPEMLSSSLFGMSFTGADICGFIGNTTKTLCNRWMQLGAFYPFSRNHNALGTIHQDPVAFGKEVIDSSIKALTIRYTLLPYLYTLLYKAHVHGDTVVRPLFFEFPEDSNTYHIDRAFLWGSGLYIVPVTEDYSTHVWTYLPKGVWYDWYSETEVFTRGQQIKLYAPLDQIPLLVRGGSVLPTQKPAQTTTVSRKNDFTFLVYADEKGDAEGSLYWDDGDSLETVENNKYGLLHFKLVNNQFTSHVVQWNTEEAPKLYGVIIRGLRNNITNVLVNGKPVNFEFKNKTLKLLNQGLNVGESFDVTWS